MYKVDLSNKRYMCLASFWQDKHNAEMAKLSEELMSQRSLLTQLTENNKNDFFQRNDGSVEIVEKKGFLGFLAKPEYYETKFIDDMNKIYFDIKKEMKELSKKAIKEVKKY